MRIVALLACVLLVLEVTLSKQPKDKPLEMICKPQNWTENERACKWTTDGKNGKPDPQWGMTDTTCLNKTVDFFLSLKGLVGHDAAVFCTLTLKGCQVLSVYMTRSGDYATECFWHTCLTSNVHRFGLRAKKDDKEVDARVQVFCDKKCDKITLTCGAGDRGKYCPGAKNYCLKTPFELKFMNRE